jgi:hypothetical protein
MDMMDMMNMIDMMDIMDMMDMIWYDGYDGYDGYENCVVGKCCSIWYRRIESVLFLLALLWKVQKGVKVSDKIRDTIQCSLGENGYVKMLYNH